MSNKRKSAPQNSIEWFMSHLLFTQRFEFETSLDIDTVVERLNESAYEPKGWRHTLPRFKLKTEKQYDHYQFDLQAKDDRQQYTIAHATGSIDQTLDNGARVVGEVRFGVVYFFLLGLSVLWMIFIFQFFGLRIPPWMLALVMSAPLFTFGHMFWKRYHLLKDIRETITPRMSDRNFDKLKRQDATDDAINDDLLYLDNESQRYDEQ